MTKRLLELERIAKERFIEHSDWSAVIQMLDDEELKEYYYLRGQGTVSIEEKELNP